MGTYTKNPGGYIGFQRNAYPNAAGGIWNLQQHYIESTENNWINQYSYKNSGSYTGWWQVNSPSLNYGDGNPAIPSMQVASNQYAYTIPIPNENNLLFKTIIFKLKILSGAVNFHFACRENGQGPSLRLDARSGKVCGLMYSDSWTSLGTEPNAADPGAITLAMNMWHTIAIELGNGSRATWYVDGLYCDIQPVLALGKYIGINAAGVGNILIDDITVYNGQVATSTQL